MWEILVSEEDPSSPILAVYRVDGIILITIYAWGEAEVKIGDGYGHGRASTRIFKNNNKVTSRKDVVKCFFEKRESIMLKAIHFANNLGNKINPYIPELSECEILNQGGCFE